MVRPYNSCNSYDFHSRRDTSFEVETNDAYSSALVYASCVSDCLFISNVIINTVMLWWHSWYNLNSWQDMIGFSHSPIAFYHLNLNNTTEILSNKFSIQFSCDIFSSAFFKVQLNSWYPRHSIPPVSSLLRFVNNGSSSEFGAIVLYSICS